MSVQAIKLAAALDDRGVIAVVTGETVRAWISGRGSQWITVYPAADAEPVWAWQRNGRAGTHPCCDPDGAAKAIAAFLEADPP
jgi:hypothetical protein